MGVGSCTAAGCHGGGRADRVIGSEYNVWISRDPHARAYSALFEERSQRMIRQLNGLPAETPADAHKDARCLACHSMTESQPLDSRRDVVSDGVGCEACHGPAEGWLGPHIEPGFAGADRDRIGFWNTDSLLVRTQTCVRCHVGGRDHDVNHHLIAAGHPRLQFEMGAYLDAMPKHWNDAEDRQGREADFDALVWAVGQACTSQAALEQLARRADSGGSAMTWPEFAEWSCSACHHDLQLDAPRQSSLAGQGPPGRLIEWDTWNYFATRDHAQHIGQAFRLGSNSAQLVEDALKKLETEMRRLSPDRRQVAALARGTANELGRWAAALEQSRINPQQVDTLTGDVLATQLQRNVFDWDNAAQTYDALASLHQSRIRFAPSTPANDALTSAIKDLFNDLAEHRKSPRENPLGSTQIQQRLIEIRNLLPRIEAQR